MNNVIPFRPRASTSLPRRIRMEDIAAVRIASAAADDPDPIASLMEAAGLTFNEAVEAVAARAGIKVRYELAPPLERLPRR